MSTAINVDIDQQTDIEISLSEVSIDIDLGRCNNTDIDIDVFSFGGGVPVMTAREISKAHVKASAAAGTYSTAADFSGMQTDPKYLVFIYNDAGPRSTVTGVSMSYTSGDTVIVPTASWYKENSWFGTADGLVHIGYYIGDDIPLTGTIAVTVTGTLNDDGYGYLTVVAGTAFGNVAFEGHFEDNASGAIPPLTTYYGDENKATILGFGSHGGNVTYDGAQSNLVRWDDATGYNESYGGTSVSYSWALYPESLELGSPLLLQYVQSKGALAVIALSDDADVSDQISLYGEPNRVKFLVDVDHDTDIEIAVERGSCWEPEPET